MIFQQIKDAHMAARKARDSVKLTTLTTLLGELTTLEKNENHEATDKDVVKVLTKFITNAGQVADAYVVRGDKEKQAEAVAEAELYTSFLPAAKPQLTDAALLRVIRSTIAAHIAHDCAKPKMGVVLAGLKVVHEGEYDPKKAAMLVKAELDATATP